MPPRADQGLRRRCSCGGESTLRQRLIPRPACEVRFAGKSGDPPEFLVELVARSRPEAIEPEPSRRRAEFPAERRRLWRPARRKHRKCL